MSRPKPVRMSSAPLIIDIPGTRPIRSRTQPFTQISQLTRSAVPNPKLSRTSKTSQRHVLLPSEPQTRPLPDEEEQLTDLEDRDIAVGRRPSRTLAERLTKDERERAGYARLTAYSVAESIKMKHLAAFLKREHAVLPRVFDEALYVVYHLPLLPGYVANVNLRSSPAPPQSTMIMSRMSEDEEYGYEGTYFPEVESPDSTFPQDGYISSSPLTNTNIHPNVTRRRHHKRRDNTTNLGPLTEDEHIAEAIFFSYGVAVFFGLSEMQERDIIEDLESAGAWVRKRPEEEWEVEECHYIVRINKSLRKALKTRSHLLSLSIAHALAQSTLLAHYETLANQVLSHSSTTRIPKELATTGSINLTRGDATRLSGKLFTLRTTINLVSNVLDVPELFWSEASLKGLYDAVREYLEISPRVHVLNERLGVANELLDIIHDHVNTGAMDRITWIIIWLIVVACLVELVLIYSFPLRLELMERQGELLARLIVRTSGGAGLRARGALSFIPRLPIKSSAQIPLSSINPTELTPEEALQILQRMMNE
ncbi:hypothetical protein Clacol_009324 [Clathrus columnatus]|uniref:DUF155 domain-containing protein n=1 Tax=Clathrus columnatus TaxID=1419009 RepID=A0AAV5APG1_9AGAM|nr:hypothetical protein Clacol_009324 [Clathrus columnatus]